MIYPEPKGRYLAITHLNAVLKHSTSMGFSVKSLCSEPGLNSHVILIREAYQFNFSRRFSNNPTKGVKIRK